MAARSPSTRSGQSLAERYRAHGEAFVLALELGCTPREAEAEIRRRQARLRWLAGEQRRQARTQRSLDFARPLDAARDRNERVRPLGSARDRNERDPQPWMMRD